MAWDTTNDEIFFFGGRTVSGTLLADSWRFDPTTNNWTQLTGTMPSARYAHSLVYDPVADSFILIGGLADAGDTVLSDVWWFDGSWAEETASLPVPVPAYAQWIYENARDQCVLFTNGATWLFE
jgi:hypothetical protein